MAYVDELTGKEKSTGKTKQNYDTLETLNNTWSLNKNNYGTDAKGTNEYWKAYQSALTDFGTKNASNKEFDTTTYNLYKNYVDQNASAAKSQYDAYILNQNNALDSKLEQSNMKDNAMKYAAQQMANSGMGSQGIAQSYQSAIGNNYASNIANINNNKATNDTSVANAYGQAILDSQNTLNNGLMENTANQKSNAFEMATSMLENATSENDLNKIKSIYYDSMSEEQQKVFDYYAQNINNDSYSGTTYTSVSDLQSAKSTTGKKAKTIGEDFNYETQELEKQISRGLFNYGDTILLENGDGKKVVIKYTANGLQVYDSNNVSSPTYTIKYDGKKSTTVSKN